MSKHKSQRQYVPQTSVHDPRRCYMCGKRAEFRYLCHRCLEQLPSSKKHQIHQLPLEQYLASLNKYKKKAS